MKLKTILKYFNYKLTGFTEHDLHSPFIYNFYTELIINSYTFDDFERLKKLRKGLLYDQQSITIKDLGAGSKKMSTTERKISNIVRHGISQQKQAEFIYRLINKFKPQNIIELGTSIGLTSLYLSLASAKSNVYTLEGCPALLQFSNDLFKKQKISNIKMIPGNFNDTFSDLLSTLPTADFIYIDGNHAYEPTIHYFKLALAKKNASTIMMFDDIYWSDDMEKAWKEIYSNPEVTLSMDFFHFGIVFFRTEQKNKEHVVLKF